MSTATPLRLLLVAILLATVGPLSALARAAEDDDSATTAEPGDDDSATTAEPGDDDSGADTAQPAEQAVAAEPAAEICDDELDNDGDGLVDCKDLNDCAAFATCGQIRGGWSWVIAAYGISFAALLAYTLMVTLRLRTQQNLGER